MLPLNGRRHGQATWNIKAGVEGASQDRMSSDFLSACLPTVSENEELGISRWQLMEQLNAGVCSI
jgi:hypothetical protein